MTEPRDLGRQWKIKDHCQSLSANSKNVIHSYNEYSGRKLTNFKVLIINIKALNNKCSSKKFYSDVQDTEIMAVGFKGKTNKF